VAAVVTTSVAPRKAAVVTGAGRGIGRAIAIGLAEAGFDLAIGWNSDEAAAEATAKAAAEFGSHVVLVQSDVTDEASADALAAVSADVLGGLDLWVNNAGISVLAPLLETTADDARRQMDVNYLGTFHGLVAAGRAMTASGGGRIVNIASDLGLQAAPLLAAYSASKFAVVGLTQAAAIELAPYGITVNAVCPGTVETDMVLAEERAEAAIEGTGVDEVRGRLRAAVPVGRLCTGADVAGTVVFLASDAASFFTGQAICINGGSVLH
jgi:NAD(P)-dependent dehydrogenase (short-subunit alcohol dehydrogenase family)